MKRSFAMLMALLLVLQIIPSDVFADPTAAVQETQSVITVSFGGEEYLFANGSAMETLPEAEERSRQVFDGWYFGGTKIEVPFTPESDMQLEARYVHRGTLIAETEYAELWYGGDADVPSLTPADVNLQKKGEEPLEANIFTPAPAADIDIEFKVSAHLYALDSRGVVCEDLGWAEAGTGTTISPEKFPGYCLALEAPEEDEKEKLVLSEGSPADAVLRVEKMDLQPELTTSEGKKVTEYDTLFAASVTVADGKGNPVHNSSSLSYTDGAVLAAAVEGRRIVVMKNGEEIPCEVDKDTLTFTMNGQGQVGIYAFDDIVSWTWGQDSAPGRKSAKSTGSKASDYRMSMSGMMPYGTSASVKTVEAEIPGEEVLFAAEVTLKNVYGYDAVPRNGAIRVTVSGAGIGEAEDLHVFRVEGKETREITDVKVEGDRVTFGADAAGTYAVTQTIEQTVSIGGATYKITVTYGSDAMIPGGAELDVKEVSGDSYITDTAAALKLGEGDEIFYTKFLDIAIMADGKEIEPQAPVQVIVELLDVEAGAEALEVVHFGDKGAEKVEAQADAEGRVTFTADSFSVYGFGSILKSLLSWTGDAVSYTLQGFSALLAPTYTAIGVQLEEGLEALGAYRVDSLLGNILNLLYVKVSAQVDLGERESVAVYSVKDGEIGELLSEGTDSGSIALGNAEGFAVVKDSGYRHMTFDLGQVTLDGMMPKAAEAEATDVAREYADFAKEGTVLAAYDISIGENGEKYQPDADHPVDVSIDVPDIEEVVELHIWHIKEDGTTEEISNFTVEGSHVRFTSAGFSVYAIVDGDESTPGTVSRKYSFFTDDTFGTPYTFVNENGVTTSVQYVTEDGTLYNPDSPGEVEGKQFIGWAAQDGTVIIPAGEEGVTITGITGTNEEVKLYPRYDDVYYLEYYDEHNHIFKTENSANGDFTVDSNGNASLKDGEDWRIVYQPDSSTQAFLGWTTNHSAAAGSEVSTVDFTDAADKIIKLYPVKADVYWIHFDKNDLVDGESTGALYVAPKYVLMGNSYNDQYNNAELPTTTRPGYRFVGWYYKDNNDNLTLAFDKSAVLSGDVTVYAKWEPAAQTYTIIILQQAISDSVIATDEEKMYDYRDSYTIEGVTGGSATISDEYKGLNISGFRYDRCDSDTTIAADGSTVLNVYYDREIVTFNFYIYGKPGVGGYYYGVDNNKANSDYNNNTTIYGLDANGNKVSLTRRQTSTITTHYLSQSDNGAEYTGDIYERSGYSFVIASLPYDTGKQYYYISGWYAYTLTWVTKNIPVYSWFLNGEEYSGPLYEYKNVNNGNTNQWYVYKIMSGLYGSSLNGEWPASDGYWWYSGYNNQNQGSGTRTTMLDAFLPTSNDMTVNFYGSKANGTTKISFYQQNIDDEGYTLANEVTSANAGFNLSDKYNGFTLVSYRTLRSSRWSEWITVGELMENNGNYYYDADPYTNGYQNVSSGYSELEIRFKRNKYTIDYLDGFSHSNANLGSVDALFGKQLSEYDRADPGVTHEGYKFTGWYTDPDCKTLFDFSKTMPANNIALYAGWEKLKYRVWIQPNGGVLSETESTYFRNEWGQLIQSYDDVETTGRNYYEDEAGEYSYVYICDPSNVDLPRAAYYKKTTDLSPSAPFVKKNEDGTTVTVYYDERAHTDGKHYKQQQNVYQFVGWYKVGGTISEDTPPEIRESDELTLWNFNTPVTENTAIRAIWKRVGSFSVSYDANMYDENGTEILVPGATGTVVPNQTEYTYGDLAQAIAGASPTLIPENYTFVGWKTPAGETIQPDDVFTIHSALAKLESGAGTTDPKYVYTLTAVYKQIGTTSITYDINCPNGSMVTSGQLTDYGSQAGNTQTTTGNNTISDLLVNGAVVLSDGSGFAVSGGYKLIGWSDKPIDPTAAGYDIKLENGAFTGTIPNETTLYHLGGTYGVDGDSNTLWAVWEKVEEVTLTLKKLVTGAMGDRTKEFTITINISDPEDVSYTVTKNGTLLAITDNSFTIKDNDTVVIGGLPVGTVITLTENDNQGGVYTKTWMKKNETTPSSDNNSLTITMTDDFEYTLTNYLPAVAPTGYRVTVTPYLMMLLAGVALLLLRARRAAEKGGGAV